MAYKNTKIVSVIIPTYNRANFLQNAVKSIIDQKYENTEIIIVDDRSTDNTQEVVHSLKEKYPNIIYCHNERSKGPSGARNTGILKSSGEYLSFLDSDDIWLDGHLAKGLKILNDNNEIDVLFGNFSIVELATGKHLFNFFDQQKILNTLQFKQLAPGIKILQDNLFKAIIQSNFFHFGSSIIRKSSIDGVLIDEAIMFAEDRDFAINLIKQNSAVFAMHENVVFILHKHASNIYNAVDANNRQKLLETNIYLYTKYLKVLSLSSDESKLLNKTIAENLSNLSYCCWMNSEHNNCLSNMLKSFKYSLTVTQLNNLFKMLIFPIIRHRYNN